MIRPLVIAVVFAAILLGLAAGLRYAESTGMLQTDAAKRTIQALIGLSLAAYANVMPKQIGRPRSSPRAESWAQAALRVGGWSLTLAGLAYAGLWAFAPLAVADTGGLLVVGAALLTTLGFAARSFIACRAARSPPAAL
jgi:hypothetical protein